MKKFYLGLKIFYALAAIFFSVIFIFTCIYCIPEKNWTPVLLMTVALFGLGSIAIGIWLYYRNIVIEVSFDKFNTIIKTNSHVFCLPSTNFTEINDAKSLEKIYLFYSDENINRKFVFQKRYSPFRTHSLNIDEMKRHMTSAVFRES